MPTLTLPERCDRSAAETLLPELIALAGSDLIEIDGRGVTQVGQAVLQLLVSTCKSAGVVTIAASPALREAAALAGLTDVLLYEAKSS